MVEHSAQVYRDWLGAGFTPHIQQRNDRWFGDGQVLAHDRCAGVGARAVFCKRPMIHLMECDVQELLDEMVTRLRKNVMGPLITKKEVSNIGLYSLHSRICKIAAPSVYSTL